MKKIKALLYCTKAKPTLYKQFSRYDDEGKMQGVVYHCEKELGGFTLNGTIPCECEIEVEKLPANYIYNGYWKYETLNVDEKELLVKSCLDYNQLLNYLRGYNGYALHISNLKMFDKPRELSDYYHYDDVRLTKAPQNMMSVYSITEHDDYVENNYCGSYEEFEEYVLISIQPQWLCKILNGEKTIEIRKQVLNCMKGNE